MTSRHSSSDTPFASLRWAFGGVLVMGLLSRVIGIAREVLVAGLFGTSDRLDAIFLGTAVPLTFCLGLGAGLGRAMVPVSAQYSGRLLGGFFIQSARWVIRRVSILAALVAASAILWSRWMVPGQSSIPVAIVSTAAVIGSFAMIGSSFTGVCQGVSNAQAKHVTAALSPIIYNLFIIASIVLLGGWLGPLSIVVGILMAEWGQALPMWPYLNRLTARVRFPGEAALKAMRELLPAAIFLSMAGSLMTLVDRLFAAGLPGGSVSALAYAERLLLLPVSLIGMALQQPLFSRLSHFAAKSKRGPFELTLELGLRLLFIAGAPMVILFVGFSNSLIAVLLQRGAFTAESTALTAFAVRGYAAAIVFHSMIPLLMGAALASGKATRVSILYLGAIVLNAILDALLVKRFGLLGITIATSIISVGVVAAMILMIAPALIAHLRLWHTASLGILIAASGLLLAGIMERLSPWQPDGFAGHLTWLVAGGFLELVVLGALFGRAGWTEYRSLKALAGGAGRHLRPRPGGRDA